MPPFVAYHALSGAEHQQRVDTLSPQGYDRFRSASPGDPFQHLLGPSGCSALSRVAGRTELVGPRSTRRSLTNW